MTSDAAPLLPLLKQYFGFTAFRPLQEEIIRDALAGRDVLALLPTGGGKSLCFQLPALLRPGLTVVVSPLIALMKDQVDALTASGVPATFLNSSLEADVARSRLSGLHRGAYRLLYVAPERLMLSGMLADLARWQVSLIAVDEAHCISEWGHDFRPEYRQLAELREHLPDVPVMALTATATERVRADIVRHLRLREPGWYVAGFNRPNLTYRVIAKHQPYGQLLEFARSRERESGIVYCQSRKTVEGLAERLRRDGVEALPYHAGLTSEQRARHQDRFLRDEARVICATIAFGMGINKPNVRFVVHYDLPKNLEGYYQETGRAGRDGLPSDCLLLFGAGDVVKYRQFIEDKPDAQERRIAREQLQQMVQYAECALCRRASLLRYFGETYDAGSCGACDNCLSPRETYDGTLEAHQMLSCVYRIRQHSGFGTGLIHVIEVLTGAQTEKIRRLGHERLSTYGIGRSHSRVEWAAIGREMIRLGLLEQTADTFSVVALTEEGQGLLRERRSVTLTKPVAAPPVAAATQERRAPGPRRGAAPAASPAAYGTSFAASMAARSPGRAGEIACDEALFERLRRLRKRLADERDVPAYIVFSDVTLRQMARDCPRTEAEFARISGVGEKKLREFAAAFLAEIAAHRQSAEPARGG